MTFSDCRFDRVMWANVRLDSKTVFKKCHFVGGLTEHTSGLGLCQFDDCAWDDEAREMIRVASTREGGRTYTREDLRADIGAVIRRFVSGGGFLQTMHKKNLRRGTIRESKHGDQIIEHIVARLLEGHHLSGAPEGGYNVRADTNESVLFFASNGVFSGPLKDVYEELVRKLKLD